ncbi:uncharacterized protein EI97DRAFT_468590 [Westerdykella ornata]|uniref:Nuclear membrane fusion protein Kar5 n=1 Tax=Westerdykella ornata TaxID=318751 RepID=A0A6A6JE59_WESOR|nr:uncharacterized protein EI97DRAFT_468590 [Westerdykella ornata]KAF2274702.1 hypothetical protein EI97DRAFT_468590 [Westerdykella ornata]
MVLSNTRRRARVWLLILTLYGSPLRATQTPLHSPLASEDWEVKKDLASILKDPPIQQHERLSEALQIIHPIQSGPRCHYQAALNLLNDCKFLESASPDVKVDSEATLQQLETIYAARLAVCELMSANVPIPPDCKVVTPSPEACIKKRSGYTSWFSQAERPNGDRLCYPGSPPPKEFQRCMKALFSQNQSWMSYSNARQNAVVMCHASRDVIEKEKNLSFYKNLGEAVSVMASILEQYNQKIKAWLTEHDALVEKIRASSEHALVDMQEGLSTFDTIRSAFRSFAGMMSHMTESYSQEISKNIEKSKMDMEQHRQELQQHHEEMAEFSLKHAADYRTQLQMGHDAALAALRSYHNAALETLQANHNAAIHKVNEVATTVDNLQIKVQISSDRMEHINQGLVNVNRTVQQLDAATERLPEMLHVLTTVGSIIASPQLWLAGIMCLFGVWKANGRVAGYFVATGGLLYGLLLLDVRTHVGAAWNNLNNNIVRFATTGSPAMLSVILFALFFVLSFVLHLHLRSAYLYVYEDERGEKGVLPSIEMPHQPESQPPRKRGPLSLFKALHLAS